MLKFGDLKLSNVTVKLMNGIGANRMRHHFTVTTVAVLLACASAAAAQSQLARSAGLTAEEASGMTLNQIVAAKNNADLSWQDQQIVVSQQVPGSNPELVEMSIDKYNADQSFSDRLNYDHRSKEVTSLAFQETVDLDRHAQLIAAAGLTREQASGMTVGEIASVYLDSMH